MVHIASLSGTGAVAGAAVAAAAHASRGQVVAAGVAAGAAGFAAGWNSLSQEDRDGIKQSLWDVKCRLNAISKETMDALPNTFLTDIILGINWQKVGPIGAGSAVAYRTVAYLKPKVAKALVKRAISVVDKGLEFFEAGGPANVMICGCVMLTCYQMSMCMELRALRDAATTGEFASLLGIDIVQLEHDVNALADWWRGISVNMDFGILEEFLLKSDLISLRIEEAQRTLTAKRNQLEVKQKKSECIQVATGLLCIGFGAAAFRAGTVFSKVALGAGVSATGFASSTWYLNNVDLGLERLHSLNIQLKGLAVQVNAPIRTLEMRINMVDVLK